MRVLSVFLICAFWLLPSIAQAGPIDLFNDITLQIRQYQQSFHRELAAAIRAIQDGGVQAAWGLIVISFFYGVFHAAGPGHGKAVIGTYLLSQESQLKKGIFLSFASAFVQGISAIVLVGGFVIVIGLTSRAAKDMVPYLEMTSFLLIALIGVYLIQRTYRAYRHHKAPEQTSHEHGHEHGHGHGHEHGHHHHDHHHDHTCATCGHSHAPDPSLLDSKKNVREIAAIIFSIGIRPCSGSVLILVFAELLGLRWAGIGSVFAISLGTAITVSVLAILAVYFRKTALYIAKRQGSNLMLYLSLITSFLGGAFIIFLGLSLFWQASQTSHPLF